MYIRRWTAIDAYPPLQWRSQIRFEPLRLESVDLGERMSTGPWMKKETIITSQGMLLTENRSTEFSVEITELFSEWF
jgi:hypothetical protein